MFPSGRLATPCEAALGLGIASGPLLGGVLGGISWRGPFFGTAVLMAIGFVLIVTLLGPVPKPEREVSLADPLRALGTAACARWRSSPSSTTSASSRSSPTRRSCSG